MSSEIAISAESLGKSFRLGQRVAYKTVRESVIGALRTPFRRAAQILRGRAATETQSEPFWAFRDVNFDLQRGKVLGVIGRNGSGKSTLLKVLARITEPSEGRAIISGRVGSLLEVGTGFHPELTGRENIILSGAILGMARKEIHCKFDEIVAFAEVDQFIDTPVKHYSSGMYLRLAFAVAAHLEPEILLVDEVLAVGDREFQQKCLGKMEDVASHGRTIFFVSHNMMAIETMCDEVLTLEKGEVVFKGPTCEGIREYQRIVGTSEGDVDLVDHEGRRSGMPAFCQRLRVLNSRGICTTSFVLGDDLVFEVQVSPNGDTLTAAGVSIALYNNYGQTAISLKSTAQCASNWNVIEPTVFRCRVKDLRLAPGQYRVCLNLLVDRSIVDSLDDITVLDIDFSDIYGTGQTHRLSSSLMHPSVDWECIPFTTSQLLA